MEPYALGESPQAPPTPQFSGTKGLGSLRDTHLFLLVIIVALALYAKSFFYQYTYSDDVQLVVQSQNVLGHLSNFFKLFTSDVFLSFANPQVMYRPVFNVVFMLELQISKNSPMIFHITNVLVHIGCTLVLFAVLKQLRVTRALAIAATLIFCVHPLNASAVVWIPGRNDTLLALLVFVSFYFFLRWVATGNQWKLLGHFVFFLLAMFTKESSFVLPVLCVAYLVVVRRERFSASGTLLIIAEGLVTFLIWLVLRGMVSGQTIVHQHVLSYVPNFVHNVPAFLLYVGKAILPFNLSIFPNLHDHSLMLGLVGTLALVVGLAIRKPRSFRETSWGLLWFLLFLAPTMILGGIFHEHRAYCAFLGLLFAVTQFPFVQSADLSRPGQIIAFVVLLLMYSFLTLAHSEEFRNRESYATSAYLNDPSVDVSSAALAGLFLDEGDNEEAVRVLQRAIAQDSNMKFVHRLLGDAYASQHEFGLAAKQYEASIKVDPLQLYAYVNYGKMCLDIGKPDSAVALWRQCVAVDSSFVLGYYYLAVFYTYDRKNADSASIFVDQLRSHGVAVLPQLLHDIQTIPGHGKEAI